MTPLGVPAASQADTRTLGTASADRRGPGLFSGRFVHARLKILDQVFLESLTFASLLQKIFKKFFTLKWHLEMKMGGTLLLFYFSRQASSVVSSHR